MEKKRTDGLMEMLALEKTVVQTIKTNGVKSYGHVLLLEDGHVLRNTLEFEMKGKKKRGRPKKTCKTLVRKETKSVGLEKKDVMNRTSYILYNVPIITNNIDCTDVKYVQIYRNLQLYPSQFCI